MAYFSSEDVIYTTYEVYSKIILQFYLSNGSAFGSVSISEQSRPKTEEKKEGKFIIMGKLEI